MAVLVVVLPDWPSFHACVEEKHTTARPTLRVRERISNPPIESDGLCAKSREALDRIELAPACSAKVRSALRE